LQDRPKNCLCRLEQARALCAQPVLDRYVLESELLEAYRPSQGVYTQRAGSAARQQLHPGSANRQLNHERSIILDLRASSKLSLKAVVLFERKDDRRNTDKIVHIREQADDGTGALVT
jgi:hypothetical protein